MIQPDVSLAEAFNAAVRGPDEWFDDPDDLVRLNKALSAIDSFEDPVDAAAVLAYRVTRAQAFGEGNKRTALLLARWLLDNNGKNGSVLLPADDRLVADLLVRAAAGIDVESELRRVLKDRDE